ncbi:KfrA protein [Aeromonas jandaei]|uniref:DNA-binding protein n=1 Tax=Aeromonas jandaei TaxID=650 RepID=UPI001C5A8205|nr:DNA-binding protein [Aeromonas jandaei]MBW3808185.1 KfrA protein [Aeromonas jandaei]
MAVSLEVQERIIQAANSLNEQCPAGEYPTVEAVRQKSRAAMSAVVEVMKGWRESQRKQVQVVREPLPSVLQEQFNTLGQSLWETAQQLANESLDAARAGFEAEKSDLLQLSAEQSAAFELQALALDEAQAQIAAQAQQLLAYEEVNQGLTRQLAELRQALQLAEQATALAVQRSEDTERRAVELRTELDHAHLEAEQAAATAQQVEDALRHDADQLRTERDRALQRLELAEREQEKQVTVLADRELALQLLRDELATTKAQAEAATQLHTAERQRLSESAQQQAGRLVELETQYEAARQEIMTCRELAAGQRGELEATRSLLATLSARIGHEQP